MQQTPIEDFDTAPWPLPVWAEEGLWQKQWLEYQRCQRLKPASCGPTHKHAFLAGWQSALNSQRSDMEAARIAYELEQCETAQSEAAEESARKEFSK